MTFPPCPPGAPGLPDTCVKVDVFRNQTRLNPLPTFMGRLAGVNNQGVRATATAQILTGDTTDCMRPWAVLDKWLESAENPADGAGPDPGLFQPTDAILRLLMALRPNPQIAIFRQDNQVPLASLSRLTKGAGSPSRPDRLAATRFHPAGSGR